jgi:repressor LexA
MVDAGIKNGDAVYIRKQPTVENGQIAAVRINGEATLKRVYINGNTMVLQPANASYPPLTYSLSDLEDVAIEGLAVGFTHWF